MRALGWTAPARALYEGAKRAGAHDLVLGERATARAGHHDPGRIRRDPAGLGRLTVPPTAATRAHAAARSIVDGHIELFGVTRDVGTPIDWHRAPDTGEPWPTTAWWHIDIRATTTPGEIKQIWELGRARHLVLLARAASLGDPDARARLVDDLTGWFDQNPPERGIHWYSNLELALRVLVWIEVLARVPDLPESLVEHIRRTLPLIARHVLVELPYTLSTMRNNHLLGDALGMIAIGHVLPYDPWARRARRAGERIWCHHLDRQVRPDGSMIEDSLSYHRFVLDLLTWRVRLDGDPSTQEALVRGAQFLARLGVLDDDVPQHGDWDEGRALASTGSPFDLRGTVRLALALGGTGAPAAWRDEHDECAWYVDEGVPVEAEGAERSGRDLGGGIARTVRGSTTVWLKAGSGPSHGHADLLSIWPRDGGHWVLSDPGTGTYNGPLAIRNWFRSSVAHPVLRVGDEDQLVPHRSFRWQRTATGRVGPPTTLADGRRLVWGIHDAYRETAGRVARAVVVGDGTVEVCDWVERPDGRRWALGLPLFPSARWDGEAIVLQAGTRWLVTCEQAAGLTAHTGEEDPFDGWWSTTLETWTPATRVELGGTLGPGRVRWALRREDVAVRSWPDLALEWIPTGAALDVDDGHGLETLLISGGR